jgi:hypothetical protein
VSLYELEHFGPIGRPYIFKATEMEINRPYIYSVCVCVLVCVSVCLCVLRDGRPRGKCRSQGRVKNSHFSISSRPALGPTQPPWVTWAWVKKPGSEAEHSPPTNAEVKKMWTCTSTPPLFKNDG